MKLLDTFAAALRTRRSEPTDALRVPRPAPAGDPTPNDPAEQADWPQRPLMLSHLRFGVQSTTIGFVVPQAGAGRLIFQPRLVFGDQSLTPEPDRRIIARPMPTSGQDARQVIR